MKHFSSCVAILSALIGLSLFAPMSARAGWQLYDNFSSGSISAALWDVDTSGGTVSVVGGKAKFVHSNPTGRVRLFFKNQASIKGVKAKVYIVKSFNDFRARIGGYVALTPEGDPAWQEIIVTPEVSKISSNVEVDDAVTHDQLVQYFYTSFTNPSTLIGKWFNISVAYPNPNTYTFSVSGQGKYTFTLPAGTLVEGGQADLHIGTRSKNGTGTGTLYFDDVYVLK